MGEDVVHGTGDGVGRRNCEVARGPGVTGRGGEQGEVRGEEWRGEGRGGTVW